MRFILNRKSEFNIYQFIINDTILYPLGERGGLWWKFEINTQDRTLSKNNYPGLVFYQKNSRTSVSMNLFLLKLIIWNIDIHTCLLGSTFLCPHLFLYKYIYFYFVGNLTHFYRYIHIKTNSFEIYVYISYEFCVKHVWCCLKFIFVIIWIVILLKSLYM